MFDADDVKLFVKAAIEIERHGILPIDTEMQLEGIVCCGACAVDLIRSATEEAL